MKLIVIDKSALRAAPRGLLKELQGDFAFLLTDTLLHEIGTEKLRQGATLSTEEEAHHDRIITATMRRAMQEAGNSWVERESAIRWETEHGVSAAADDAPRLSLLDEGLPDILSCSTELYDKCMEYEMQSGLLASTPHEPSEDALFQRIRGFSEAKFFEELRRDYCSAEERRHIAKEAKETIGQGAKELGYRVVPTFTPGPGWLAFGMILSKWVFLRWKFWRYGDEPADRSKPANPWYDTDYIAYMAIADGLLSADRNQLKLAWACWPEKESSIYSLNTQDHTISKFRPEWSR